MKHPYLKTILLCLCMFASINAFAEAVEIDGIYYNLVTKIKEAEVTKKPGTYSGTVNIPGTFTYNGVTYSVTSIGEGAFSPSLQMKSISIPNTVTSIGTQAFYGALNLTKVIVSDVAAWCGIKFADGMANPLHYARHLYSDETTEIKNLIIPNSVTSIGDYTFRGCSYLTSITIPNSVKSIGRQAFADCQGLSSVTIPNSVTSINGGAFEGCSKLKKVIVQDIAAWCGISFSSSSANPLYYTKHLYSDETTEITNLIIPNSVTSIGDYAFNGCSGLTSLNIGNSVKSIGSSAFANCAELTDVYCHAENVPTTRSDAFADSYIEYATLHVPAVSVEQYKATAPWSNFGTIVTIDDPLEKCATPTISYSKGELTFSCDTEGAEFVSKITDADIKDYFTSSISLSVTYNISVYATKAGYENSDTIQATLCWIEQQPQTEGITDEDAIAEVQAVPVLIQTQGNTINVQGAEAGTEIILYGANGVQLDSVVATTGVASLNASRLSGSVAIVKIGNKTVKVLVKQ